MGAADDYVTKTVSPRELVARVKAIFPAGRHLQQEAARNYSPGRIWSSHQSSRSSVLRRGGRGADGHGIRILAVSRQPAAGRVLISR